MVQYSESHDAPAAEPEWSESLLSYFSVLWRRKWTALVVFLATIAFGCLYCFQASPRYRCSAQILLIKRDKLPVGEDRDREARYGNYKEYGYEDTVSTHMILICSPKIVRRAVSLKRLAKLESLKPPDDVMDRDAYVTQKITGSLKASRTGDKANPDPNVMNLSYDGTISDDCATVLKAIVASYELFLKDAYKSIGDDTLDLISKAKDDLTKQITDKERDYLKFQKDIAPTLIYLPNVQQPVTVPEARTMEIEKARSELIVALAKTKALISSVDAALKKGANRQAITLLMMRVQQELQAVPNDPRMLGELKLLESMADEQQAIDTYGPDHPKVKTMRKTVAMMREHFGDVAIEGFGSEGLVKAFVGSLKEEMVFLEERRIELDKLFTHELKESRHLAGFRYQDEAFRAEVTRSQQLFDATMKQLDQVNLVKDYGGITMQLLSGSINEPKPSRFNRFLRSIPVAAAFLDAVPNSLPSLPADRTAQTKDATAQTKDATAQWQPDEAEKVWPKPVIVLLLAAMLGMGLGAGVVYLIELADRSFRTPDDVQVQLGLPIFGHIPFIGAGKPKKHAAATGLGGKAALSPVLCTVHSPKGRHAEAYRAVRTALYFGTSGEDHKVIQVTSPNPGDGKTTLAANLAVSIADSGKRVLLIDADFRRPKINKYFGLTTDIGMSALIAGEAELPDVVQETPVANLWVIPCGKRPENPGDLLTSSRFEEFISVVREKYEFVIIDSPPLLAVTDPAVIAPRVDGVLFVIRLSKHARDSALRAIDTINTVGGQVLGVIVNGLGKAAGYGYGKYGYGGYRYGRYQYSGYGKSRYGYGSYGYSYGHRPEGSSKDHDDVYYSQDSADVESGEGTTGAANGRLGPDNPSRRI